MRVDQLPIAPKGGQDLLTSARTLSVGPTGQNQHHEGAKPKEWGSNGDEFDLEQLKQLELVGSEAKGNRLVRTALLLWSQARKVNRISGSQPLVTSKREGDLSGSVIAMAVRRVIWRR